jgi:hypothetical protein
MYPSTPGALGLSIIETVLVYVGIPVLVILVITGLVFAGDVRRGGNKRYRPGRPYEFRPVWFLSAPHLVGQGPDEHKALRGGDAPAALPAGAPAEWAARKPAEQRATGGASDRW